MAASKHHYLPRSYLRGFCSDGRLWVFDREKKQFRRQTPNSIASKTGYYAVPMADGSLNEGAERILMLAEDQAKPAIEKIIALEPITDTDRQALASFIALMYL